MFCFLFENLLKWLIPTMEKKNRGNYIDSNKLIFDLTIKFRIILGVIAFISMVLMSYSAFFVPVFFITACYSAFFSLFLFDIKSFPREYEFFCFYNSFRLKYNKELYLISYLNERFGKDFIEKYNDNKGKLSEEDNYYFQKYERFLSKLKMEGTQFSNGYIEYLNFEHQLREIKNVRNDLNDRENDILDKMSKTERGQVLSEKESDLNESFKIENT